MNKYLKNTREKIQKKTTNEKIHILAKEYFSMSNKSRKILKYDLEIGINILDKISLISIACTFLVPAFTNIYGGNALLGFSFFIMYAFFIAIFIPKIIIRHTFYKLYLMIINDIENGNIIEDDNLSIQILSKVKEP